VTAWSYSSLQAFETCPRRYAVVRVYKQVKEPQTEATMHGNEVHKALELYGRDRTPIPPKYESYRPLVDTVLKAPGEKVFETKFALNTDLQPTTFFGKDCWVRGVLDLQVVQPKTAIVLDWKTGKPKTDGDQLKLFAAATFALRPHIEKVHTGYVWLAHDKLDRETFTREQAPQIWAEFRIRVERLDNAMKYDDFPPKPSGLCKNWCPVPNNICEFSGKR